MRHASAIWVAASVAENMYIQVPSPMRNDKPSGHPVSFWYWVKTTRADCLLLLIPRTAARHATKADMLLQNMTSCNRGNQ